MTGPTVADELAFEALSDDVKALVARIYGRVAVGPTVSEAEAKAYQQGWNDCIEEFESPHELSDTEAARRITRNREREAKAAEFRARREVLDWGRSCGRSGAHQLWVLRDPNGVMIGASKAIEVRGGVGRRRDGTEDPRRDDRTDEPIRAGLLRRAWLHAGPRTTRAAARAAERCDMSHPVTPDEPIMPVRGYTHAIHIGSPRSGMMVIPDYIDPAHGGVAVVVASLTPASWHAMVERAASAKDITGHVNQTTRRRMLLAAERGLIRAFNLPDGWTP